MSDMKIDQKRKINWLDRALVVTPYCYCLCLSEEQFNREMVRLHIPQNVRPCFLEKSPATVHFFESENKDIHKYIAIVCLDAGQERSASQTASVLVHEAVHIWQETKKYLDEQFPSKEFEAYSIQTISQRLLESYEKQTLCPPVMKKEKETKCLM